MFHIIGNFKYWARFYRFFCFPLTFVCYFLFQVFRCCRFLGFRFWSSIHPIQFLIWRIKQSISCFVLRLNMHKYEIVLTSIIIIFLPKDLKIYVLTFSCCCLIYVPPFLPSTLQWPEARFLGFKFQSMKHRYVIFKTLSWNFIFHVEVK